MSEAKTFRILGGQNYTNTMSQGILLDAKVKNRNV